MSAHDLDDVLLPNAELNASLSAAGSPRFHEFVRYATASALALFVDAGVLTLLTSAFGVPYLISGAVSFTLGIIVIYLLSVRWVFEHRLVGNAALEFLIFLLVGIVGLGINEIVLWICTGFFGLFYLISKAASVALVFTWNYLARKFLLFRRA